MAVESSGPLSAGRERTIYGFSFSANQGGYGAQDTALGGSVRNPGSRRRRALHLLENSISIHILEIEGARSTVVINDAWSEIFRNLEHQHRVELMLSRRKSVVLLKEPACLCCARFGSRHRHTFFRIELEIGN